MKPFFVVGMGPGGREHLLPAAISAIEESELLVGSSRHLALFPSKRGFPFAETVEASLDIVEGARRDCRVALLVAGDPCLYGIQGALRRRFRCDEYEIIPGISSFQLACARAGIGWEGAVIVSVHGKGKDALDPLEPDRPGVVFLDGQHDAAAVASCLVERMGPERPCLVARDLDGDGEAMVEGSLGEIAQRGISGLCVMILP